MNKQTKLCDQFTGLMSCSLTLRNELRPTAFTEQHLQENEMIMEDEWRAECREKLKKILDDYYRWFIDSSLLNAERLDFAPLFNAIARHRAENTDASTKELILIENKTRKQVHDLFSKREEFKDMFSAKIFEKILPDYIKSFGTDEALETVGLFYNFGTAVLEFFETRKNVFSERDISTSICQRIVHDNAAIFYNNMQTFAAISEDNGKIEQIDRKLAEEDLKTNISEVFSKTYYSKCITQKDIEEYNRICGIINVQMNLYCHQTKEKSAKFTMRSLHKQILSESKTSFEIPRMFENDDEVYVSINEFSNKLENVFGNIKCIYENVKEYDLNKIYISSKFFTAISKYISGDWQLIERCQGEYFSAKSRRKKTEEKIKEDIKKIKAYSIQQLKELLDAYDQNSSEETRKTIIDYITDIYSKASAIKLIEFIPAADSHLRTDQEKTEEIKAYLDSLMEIFHMLAVFNADDSLEKDAEFYSHLDTIYEEMGDLVNLYNRVRNYITQKAYSQKKFKLYFGNPQLAGGWSESKIFDYNTVLLMRDDKLYLALFNPRNKPAKALMEGRKQLDGENEYTKIVYNLIAGASKSLPKIFISSKTWKMEHGVPQDILKGYEEKRHIKNSSNFDIGFCRQLIDYFKECIEKYPNYDCFDFKFSDTETYTDISGFYKEVDQQGYKISKSYISAQDIEQLDREGKIYLFQIYNKDFSDNSHGTKNLHTMYLRNLFGEENLRDGVLQLNGGAELFYRKASITEPVIHKAGTVLVDRTYEENGVIRSIPENVYQRICKYYSSGKEEPLSEEAEQWLDKAVVKEAMHDIVKDKRYSVDKYFLHMPITINYKAQQNLNINEMVRAYIAENPDMHIIGIDRGERNLLYISVIDAQGNIVEQRSLNIIKQRVNDRERLCDYQSRLVDREKERDKARKSWQEISKIKDLKEGYLSQVVHEICQLVIKYNAVIMMEELNYGFKRGRFKVERQVYQKFETMLTKKLSYLVDKKKPVDAPGGLLKGYQLACVPDKLSNVGRQNGIIFYVPAAYTSKIDPTTGFVNIFNFRNITNDEARRAFISRIDSIRYDQREKSFALAFDYNNFETHRVELSRNQWTIYVKGKRIEKKKTNYGFAEEIVSLEEKMGKLMSEAKIQFEDGHDLKEELGNLNEASMKELIEIVKLTVQLRNSTKEKSSADTDAWDRIISPVLNDKGEFFDTGDKNEKLPLDADANGAFCIALKGLYLTRKIRKDWRPGEKNSNEVLKISHREWFEFIQQKGNLGD